MEIEGEVGGVGFSELVESCGQLERPEIVSWNVNTWEWNPVFLQGTSDPDQFLREINSAYLIHIMFINPLSLTQINPRFSCRM